VSPDNEEEEEEEEEEDEDEDEEEDDERDFEWTSCFAWHAGGSGWWREVEGDVS